MAVTPTAPRPGRPLRLAVTLGDPRGIGPEVAAAAARHARSLPDGPELVFVGPEGTCADGAPVHSFHAIGRWDGSGNPEIAGALAGRAIEAATAMALDGAVDAIVTGPIDKAALNAGGYAYPGHTEMLAALVGRRMGTAAPPVAMMMVAEETALGGPLRVVLATTHIALRAVPDALSTRLFVEQARLAADGLRRGWRIERPRIALCAVNPHASDGGLFGDEEARILEPARDALRDKGIDATGPVPADTVFVRAIRGEFDVVVAPYHDVGMAAFKTAAFGKGVNVTVGLPFVRTSPDHGTAFDIAGRGIADPGSMIEALVLAARLARNGAAAQSSGI